MANTGKISLRSFLKTAGALYTCHCEEPPLAGGVAIPAGAALNCPNCPIIRWADLSF